VAQVLLVVLLVVVPLVAQVVLVVLLVVVPLVAQVLVVLLEAERMEEWKVVKMEERMEEKMEEWMEEKMEEWKVVKMEETLEDLVIVHQLEVVLLQVMQALLFLARAIVVRTIHRKIQTIQMNQAIQAIQAIQASQASQASRNLMTRLYLLSHSHPIILLMYRM